jgi:hypothetical protein
MSAWVLGGARQSIILVHLSVFEVPFSMHALHGWAVPAA